MTEDTITRILTETRPHKVLGISDTASVEDINKAFRKLALLVHPDKCQDPRAGKVFNIANEARERLLEPNGVRNLHDDLDELRRHQKEYSERFRKEREEYREYMEKLKKEHEERREYMEKLKKEHEKLVEIMRKRREERLQKLNEQYDDLSKILREHQQNRECRKCLNKVLRRLDVYLSRLDALESDTSEYVSPIIFETDPGKYTGEGWPVLPKKSQNKNRRRRSNPSLMPKLVFKLMTPAMWNANQFWSPHDIKCGFIHLSTLEQLTETARKKFTDSVDGLVVVGLLVSKLTDVRWEPAPSRNNELFAHSYADIPDNAILGVNVIESWPTHLSQLDTVIASYKTLIEQAL